MLEALRIRVVVRVLGAIPCGWGWICGGVGGRVLFSESPPLMRKDSGENPLLNGLKNGSHCGVFLVGGADHCVLRSAG